MGSSPAMEPCGAKTSLGVLCVPLRQKNSQEAYIVWRLFEMLVSVHINFILSQVAWSERKCPWMCLPQIAQFLSGVFWSCFILVTWLVTMWPTCNSFINPWNALWPTAALIKNPEQHDFEAPFSPGLGPLLLKIQPPFGPSSKILGSPSQLVKA